MLSAIYGKDINPSLYVNGLKVSRKPITQKLKYEVVKKNNFKCYLCNCDLVDFEVDHILAISVGGEDSIKNMMPICINCNSVKKQNPVMHNYYIKNRGLEMYNKILENEDMRKTIFGENIYSDGKMYSSTDLVKVGNKWRIMKDLPTFCMKTWLASKGNKEFINELSLKFGSENVRVPAKGKGSHTMVHPLLFIDIALAINPKLKVETYEWLFQELIKSRDESDVPYKKMCGALYIRQGNKTAFPAYIQDVAEKIRLACNVTNWQEASEDQLQMRSQIQNNIALLADVLNNNDEAVRIAILKINEIK
jgi:hypothetical protein